MIWYIGDVHCRVKDIKKIANDAESSCNPPAVLIQVGDFGCFWPNYTKEMDAWIHARALTREWSIPIITCGGNHDNWNLFLKLESESDADLLEIIPDSGIFYARRGSVIDIGGISHGFLGGAFSTNQSSLIENIDWWRREEPNREEFDRFYQNLLTYHPDTIITHEAPRCVSYDRIGRNSNTTVRMLDNLFWMAMKDGYQPKRHYYGHHHILEKRKIAGTKFFCCGYHGEYWIRD